MPKNMLNNDSINGGIWEKRCWNEFWGKPEQKNILEMIYKYSCEYPLTQSEMITKFINFVSKWEIYAKEHNISIYRGCDNSPFDTHYINSLIEKYIPYDVSMVFPYKMSEKMKYSTHFDIHKIQYGFVLGYFLGSGNKIYAKDMIKKNWGFNKILQEIFKYPPCEAVHDHRPDNDAHTIAYDLVCLLRLCNN